MQEEVKQHSQEILSLRVDYHEAAKVERITQEDLSYINNAIFNANKEIIRITLYLETKGVTPTSPSPLPADVYPYQIL